MLYENNLPQMRHCLNKCCSWSGPCYRATNCFGEAGQALDTVCLQPGLVRWRMQLATAEAEQALNQLGPAGVELMLLQRHNLPLMRQALCGDD